MKDNYRIEMVLSALQANSLKWNSWALDALTAFGIAGVNNRLGNKLVRFLGDPRPSAVQEITLMLSSHLIKKGHAKGKTLDAAFEAFEYWNNQRCLNCGGRGVMNFQQQECPRCNGSGRRPSPKHCVMVRDGIAHLLQAEHAMEGRLRKLLRNYPEMPLEVVHHYHLPVSMAFLEYDVGG